MDRKAKHPYEIIHPETGQSVVWSGERIEAYEVNYRVQIKDVEKKAPVKVKRSSTTSKNKNI